MNRLCYECTHFYFTTGYPDLSDVTPGEDFAMGCGKDIWSLRGDSAGDDIASLRDGLEKAVGCPSFENRDQQDPDERRWRLRELAHLPEF
jgi:hypothetical protein